MTPPQNNPADPLEPLLRRWGRDEALAQAAPPPPPSRQAIRSHPLPATLGYLAAAAAGFALAVAAWGLLGNGRNEPADLPAVSAESENFASPEDRGSGVKVDLAVVQRQREQYEAQLAQLREEVQAGSADRLERSRRDRHQAEQAREGLRQARADLKELALANRKLTEQLQELQVEVERARIRHEKHLADARKGEAVAAELARRRKAHQKDAQTLAALKRQVRSLQDQQARAALASRAELRDLYLMLTGASPEGLAGWQQAARERKLLDRCAVVRQAVRDPQAREVVDAVETLLTRLDMLDATDARASSSLAKLVRQTAVLERLENLHQNVWTTDALRTWAMEVALVLDGVSHAA